MADTECGSDPSLRKHSLQLAPSGSRSAFKWRVSLSQGSVQRMTEESRMAELILSSGNPSLWPHKEVAKGPGHLHDVCHSSTLGLPLGWQSFVTSVLWSDTYPALSCAHPINFSHPSEAPICLLGNPTSNHWWSKKAGSEEGAGTRPLTHHLNGNEEPIPGGSWCTDSLGTRW